MAMQQIGIPARTVIERIEVKRAGANPATIEGGGSAQPGGVAADPPMLSSRGAATSKANEGVGRADGDQPGPSGGSAFETPPEYRKHMRPALRLIDGKLVTSIGMRGIRPRGFPASLPRSPMLVVIDGGRDHADMPSASA